MEIVALIVAVVSLLLTITKEEAQKEEKENMKNLLLKQKVDIIYKDYLKQSAEITDLRRRIRELEKILKKESK